MEQVLRFFLRAEPAASLAAIDPETALSLDFWKLVPDGALDGAKDAKWFVTMARTSIREFDKVTASAIIRKLHRVAPATSAGAVKFLLATFTL
ncbi:hypothetical protein H9P43_009391 [Blastocladiella emersonii ATCC 22665]|nr:hypothetical protein H9P43_009391 [Blastocladiella emersonii ATCC 22665]